MNCPFIGSMSFCHRPAQHRRRWSHPEASGSAAAAGPRGPVGVSPLSAGQGSTSWWSIYKWCGPCNRKKPDAHLRPVSWLPHQQQCCVWAGIRNPGFDAKVCPQTPVNMDEWNVRIPQPGRPFTPHTGPKGPEGVAQFEMELEQTCKSQKQLLEILKESYAPSEAVRLALVMQHQWLNCEVSNFRKMLLPSFLKIL